MKKIIIGFVLFIFSQSLYSQGWLDIGLKGGYGMNFLINSNFYNDRYFSPKFSWGYMVGGKVGINFNETHAVTIDISTSSFDQSFSYSRLNADSSRSDYTRSMGFNALNFLVMYKKTSNASYFEIGPQYSIINKTRGSDNFTQTKNMDISENLVKAYYSAVMGFGGYLIGTENFSVSLGCRFSYTLNDIISEKGKQINFPALTKYDSYKSSNPLSVLMIVELNYDLGYLATSKCKKKKTRFLLFSN